MNLLLVMLGGAVGAGARHLVGRLTLALLGPGYPWGTLAVNLIGGLAMGLLLGVGLLGGFTTFSAFSLDIVTMIERGQAAAAIGYALVSVIGSVLALFAGLQLVRALA
jgi:fluoride exporter